MIKPLSFHGDGESKNPPKKSKMIKPLSFHGDGESGNELWAPFPSDILGYIASKLTAADYASACAACKSWRAVFSPHHPGLLPFLLLPPHYTLPDPLRLRSPTPPLPDYPIGPIVPFSRLDHRHSDSPFFPLDSLRNPTFRPLPSLSDTARHVCVGSSHGWLILLGPTSHISLLNPLTTDTIPLPPPLSSAPLSLTLYDENIVDRYLLFRGDPPRRLCHLAALVRLAVLSADPTDDPSSFILVLVLGNDVSSRFFTCGPSDGYAAWKPHSPISFPAYGLTDLIFHRGRCFAAITWSYSGGSLHGPADAIAVFDFHAYPAFQGLLHVRIRENYVAKDYANFLIESAGELLLVTRHGEINAGRILVHRLPPLEGDGPFVPTPEASLGNKALFLGTGNSVLVQARDFPQFIRRNCIYFTDVHCKAVNGRAVSVGCVYVFNMEKGITRKAFEVAQEHEMDMWSYLRPWWVTPNLRKRDPRAPRGSISYNTFLLPAHTLEF